MKMRKYCCKAFAKQATHYQDSYRTLITGKTPISQFEPDDDGKTWNINGCCGGGCFVVIGMAFCPFCGHNLKQGKGGIHD